MEYYVYKLNLEPRILDVFEFENNEEHVVGTVIPNDLKNVFENNFDLNEELILFSDKVEINNVIESKQYKELIENNKEMLEMYNHVVKNFEAGKGIVYSPQFLEKRDELKQSISSVIHLFPFLKGSYDLNDNVFPINRYDKVQMSVAYLRKAKKIECFVTNFTDDAHKISFIYDKKHEWIYISEEVGMEKSQDYVELIEEKINSFSPSLDIGRVTINPIYEDFKLEGMYSEITFEVVYPNGKKARNRSNAIEKGNAASETTTWKASKGMKMEVANFNEVYEDDAGKGYVKSVTSNGKNVVKSILRKVKLNF